MKRHSKSSVDPSQTTLQSLPYSRIDTLVVGPIIPQNNSFLISFTYLSDIQCHTSDREIEAEENERHFQPKHKPNHKPNHKLTNYCPIIYDVKKSVYCISNSSASLYLGVWQSDEYLAHYFKYEQVGQTVKISVWSDPECTIAVVAGCGNQLYLRSVNSSEGGFAFTLSLAKHASTYMFENDYGHAYPGWLVSTGIRYKIRDSQTGRYHCPSIYNSTSISNDAQYGGLPIGIDCKHPINRGIDDSTNIIWSMGWHKRDGTIISPHEANIIYNLCTVPRAHAVTNTTRSVVVYSNWYTNTANLWVGMQGYTLASDIATTEGVIYDYSDMSGQCGTAWSSMEVDAAGITRFSDSTFGRNTNGYCYFENNKKKFVDAEALAYSKICTTTALEKCPNAVQMCGSVVPPIDYCTPSAIGTCNNISTLCSPYIPTVDYCSSEAISTCTNVKQMCSSYSGMSGWVWIIFIILVLIIIILIGYMAYASSKKSSIPPMGTMPPMQQMPPMQPMSTMPPMQQMGTTMTSMTPNTQPAMYTISQPIAQPAMSQPVMSELTSSNISTLSSILPPYIESSI